MAIFTEHSLKLTGAVRLKPELLLLCPARRFFPLWENHRFTVSEKRVLRKLFEPMTEVAGGWTK
jgi:hypothetical protein